MLSFLFLPDWNKLFVLFNSVKLGLPFTKQGGNKTAWQSKVGGHSADKLSRRPTAVTAAIHSKAEEGEEITGEQKCSGTIQETVCGEESQSQRFRWQVEG